jgi:hypothetical protein
MLFCPGMEPFGHRESSLFAEPTENKSFSEKNPIFFSTKLEMIRKDPSWIEIAIEEIFRGMPRPFFFLPFIPKFKLANVLFHEIGHHFQQVTHGVSKREREAFADAYRKNMLKRAFWGWRFVLYPLRPFIYWLNRNAQRKCL